MSYYKYYFSSKEIEGSASRIKAKNRLIYNLLSPWLPPAASVLELGPGKGWFAQVCQEHGHKYRGVEASQDQCLALAAEGFDVTCAKVPPVPLMPPPDGFDLIYSAHLLEHLAGAEEVHELLRGCAGLARADGIVAMLFPDGLAMGPHFWNCDYTHVFPTSERRVAQAMADAGLDVIACQRLRGHYTGARQLLAGAAARPLVLKAASALARSPERRDVVYRGWMYLQQDVLLLAKPRAAAAAGG